MNTPDGLVQSKLYFVRHGQETFVDGLGEVLTDKGEQQAFNAAEVLESLGVGSDSLTLASTAARARETGLIIAELLDSYFITDTWLEECGMAPELAYMTTNPRGLVQKIIETRGLTASLNIVVVTHQPLIDRFNPKETTANGEVVHYDDSHWSPKRH